MARQSTADVYTALPTDGQRRQMRVASFRGWRTVVRDVFYDAALAVLWLATLWLLVMDVIAS